MHLPHRVEQSAKPSFRKGLDQLRARSLPASPKPKRLWRKFQAAQTHVVALDRSNCSMVVTHGLLVPERYHRFMLKAKNAQQLLRHYAVQNSTILELSEESRNVFITSRACVRASNLLNGPFPLTFGSRPQARRRHRHRPGRTAAGCTGKRTRTVKLPTMARRLGGSALSAATCPICTTG